MSEAVYLPIEDPLMIAGMRQLALHKICVEIRGFFQDPMMGELQLATWLEVQDGRAWLQLAGLGDLLERSSSDLARAVFRNAKLVMDRRVRCLHCKYCSGDERRRCDLGIWGERGRRPEYARSTIRRWSYGTACEFFGKREGEDDGSYCSG